MNVSIEVGIVGILTGLVYATLAAGIIVVHRGSRVLNFAHGQVGALASAVMLRLVLNYQWNFFVSLAAALAFGGLVGAAVELGVIRRLFNAPRLIVLIATIGVAQLLLVLEFLLPKIPYSQRYPTPLDRTLEVGGVQLASEHFMVLAFIPAALAGLTLFLNNTPFGRAIRAAAENAEAATLAGLSAKRVSTAVWVIAGMLAALSAVLIAPLRPTTLGVPTEALGPALFVRGLTAALVGRLVSIPLAVAGAVAIGIVEAVLYANVGLPGTVDAVLFAAVLVLVFTRVKGSAAESQTWSLTPKVPQAPARLQQLWWVRRLPRLAIGAGLVLAAVFPWVFSAASHIFLLSQVLLFAMIALSLCVLTGWAGQVSFGQFAFVGLGAFTTAALTNHGMPFLAAVAYATIGGAAMAVVIGYPALRVPGLFLAVATLGFSVAASEYFFRLPVFIGDEPFATVTSLSAFGVELDSSRAYYYLVLASFVGTFAAIARLRRTGIGRNMVAVRDNHQSAASFGISPGMTKLIAFGLAGALAAFSGALLGGLHERFDPTDFGPAQSLRAASMVIIGGLGSVPGALLGALYLVGLPALFGSGQLVSLSTSSVGLLVLVLYFPGGLVQVVYQARDAFYRWLDRRLGPATETAGQAGRAVERLAARSPGKALGNAIPLRCSHVTIKFGGLVANSDVSIEVRPREVVGLIGSNGAGKSTLMNAISGFAPMHSGSVELFGTDVTGLPPEARARLGAGRVFQDARLFPDLTVTETVLVALEGNDQSELVPSLLALSPSRRAEARKVREAEEYIGFLGLHRYRDAFVSDLSTGTRRIVELACLLAQDARLLLLDEPMAGIAQRETEAFGPLIGRIREELNAAVLIIEHDIPLVMSISDRVYCLSAGSVIAEGEPNVVRNDPSVIATYLGTDERAIQRSGVIGAVTGEPSTTAPLLTP